MIKFFSVSNSLLAITAVSTGLLVWLATEYWLDAYWQRFDAKRVLASNEVESLLLTGAENWAAERGLAHFALHMIGPVPRDTLRAVMTHRAAGDQAYQKAIEGLTAAGGVQRHMAPVAELERRYRAIESIREKLDFLITQPFGPRSSYDYAVAPRDSPVISHRSPRWSRRRNGWPTPCLIGPGPPSATSRRCRT